MMEIQIAKRRRMSFKQAPPMQPTPLQSAQVGLPNYTAEEDDKARRRVYLVTFPTRETLCLPPAFP